MKAFYGERERGTEKGQVNAVDRGPPRRMPRKFHDGELLLRWSLPEEAAEAFQVAKFDRGKGDEEGKEGDDDSIKTWGKNYLLGRGEAAGI